MYPKYNQYNTASGHIQYFALEGQRVVPNWNIHTSYLIFSLQDLELRPAQLGMLQKKIFRKIPESLK